MRAGRPSIRPPGLVCSILLLAVTSGGLLSACAPRPTDVADLDPGRRQTRYRVALAAREARGVGVLARLSLWVRGASVRDVPGAEARLLLSGPDAFRLRVASAFGTALDLSARGDSLSAYVPRSKVGLVVDAAGESLGVRDPGGLGYRFWSATWRPPEDAWVSAVWEDTLLKVRWLDHEDALELVIGSNGLPVSVAVTPRSGTEVHAQYLGWTAPERVFWPSLLKLERGAGDLTMTCRVHRIRFGQAPERSRLSVRLPSDAERLPWARLERALRGLEDL